MDIFVYLICLYLFMGIILVATINNIDDRDIDNKDLIKGILLWPLIIIQYIKKGK